MDVEETTDYILGVRRKVRLPDGSVLTGRVQVDRTEVYGLAHEKHNNSARIESILTKDITEVTKAVGGHNEGLKCSLKSQGSIRRKIQDEYVRDKIQYPNSTQTVEQTIAYITDANRYMCVLLLGSFVRNVKKHKRCSFSKDTSWLSAIIRSKMRM